MKKSMRTFSILTVLAILFISVSPAFAQDDIPPEDPPRKMLRDYVTAAFADALGLEVQDVLDRLEAGETYQDIAATQGIEGLEFRRLMIDVIEEAKANAMQDGVFDEEDVDRIRERFRKRRDARKERRRRAITDKILERLGITRDELASMRESGMTWAEILESLGIDIRRPHLGDENLEDSDLGRQEMREHLDIGESL